MKESKTDHIIYHFVSPSRWEEMMSSTDFYPLAFENEGFIHCCFEHQKQHVIQNYFSDKPYYILALDRSMLEGVLKIEATVGTEAFPHIYDKIDKSWILHIEK